MIEGGIKAFSGRRVLLLQGPVGPFFSRFAQDLKGVGATVQSINFNAGDWLFNPSGINYRGSMENWPAWLATRLREWQIDLVFLFGDCRPIHKAAHSVAKSLGVEVGVFEEGYIRPDFVTLERDGVNGNSTLPRSAADYLAAPERVIATQAVPHTYWAMVWWGFLYFTIGGLGKPFFPHYRHHRPLTIMEMFPWLLSPLRKVWYKFRERGWQHRLSTEWSKRFFLVPLQVHNDAQVLCHADVGGVEGFIASTIASFARHAPADTLLVLKHHPMDRAYRTYTQLIDRLALQHGCMGRIVYLHDQHTPTLIRHCLGVVVINSTVGLTAVGMKRPTKPVGFAIWDMAGLTYQGPLDRFWTDTESATPDHALYRKFRDELVSTTQVNGSFYRKLAPEASNTGLIWSVGARSLIPRSIAGARTAAAPARADVTDSNIAAQPEAHSAIAGT